MKISYFNKKIFCWKEKLTRCLSVVKSYLTNRHSKTKHTRISIILCSLIQHSSDQHSPQKLRMIKTLNLAVGLMFKAMVFKW